MTVRLWLRRCATTILLFVWLGAAARAQVDASLEDMVAELSERVDLVECENDQLRSMVLADRARVRRLSTWPMEHHGRIHVDYWAFPGDSPGVNAFETGSASMSPLDRIELRRARLSTQGDLPADMSYKIDIELSEASDPEFRDIYIGWNSRPLLGTVRFGNQKRPYGLDHLNSSNFNVFMERPFVVQAFNYNSRRFGLESYGVSADEAWNWRYGVFNLAEIQSDGIYEGDHYQAEIAGRLARTIMNTRDDSRYVHLAISSAFADPDGFPEPDSADNTANFRTDPEARTDSQWLDTMFIEGAGTYGILGLEGVVNVSRLQVTGEYMNLWLNRAPGYGDSLHFHGGYLQIAYFLTDHYQPWNRRRGIISRVQTLDRTVCGDWPQAFQVAVRWSYADLSDSNVLGGVGESLGVGFNWYWTRHARAQMNLLYGDISDHFPVDGFTAGSYFIIGTRVMIDF